MNPPTRIHCRLPFITMRTILLTLAALAAIAMCAQKTTRRNLKPIEPAVVTAEVSSATDTVASPEAHTVDLNGFDKPLRSKRETFFVTNNSARRVKAISVSLKYFDTDRNMLHARNEYIAIDIPTGETRQASLPSWDKQQSFYFRHSAVPARATVATPFDVTAEVDTIFFCK